MPGFKTERNAETTTHFQSYQPLTTSLAISMEGREVRNERLGQPNTTGAREWTQSWMNEGEDHWSLIEPSSPEFQRLKTQKLRA